MLAAIFLLISLGLDTLAVSLALGIGGLPRRRWPQVGATFVLCEGGMPVLGLAIGARLSRHFAAWAGLLAGVLLLGLGIHRCLETRARSSHESALLASVQRASGWRLLLLGVSVSLDNLAIGFSLGAVAGHMTLLLALIPLQCLVLTLLGLSVGRLAGTRLGWAAGLAAGLVLAVLGLALVGESGHDLWRGGHAHAFAPAHAMSGARTMHGLLGDQRCPGVPAAIICGPS